MSIEEVKDFLKDWKMPSSEELKKKMCEKNLKSKKPHKCPTCGSKYMYYDSSAGPIVGGIAWGNNIPNAHPIGAWICLDCQEKQYEKRKKYEEEQKRKEAPEQIKKKKAKIKEIKEEIKELEKLIEE